MRTQVMPERATTAPWLERDPHNGPAETTVLQSFPFTIGRGDSADLHVDSSQVSREHAIITRHGNNYRVRDLESTNGTFLNGVRIEEATVNDGDILLIAEVEFTFFCPEASTPSQTVTRVMQSPQGELSTRDAAWDAILAVRRTHEAVTHRRFRTLFQPIVELASDKVFGYEALAASGNDDAVSPRCEQFALLAECRATDRAHQLFRRLAAEESLGVLHRGRLFLAIAAGEIARPTLVDHLCQLRDLLGDGRQLVIEIPDSAVHATAEFRGLLAALRAAKIQVAYDGYAAGKAQIIDRKDAAPDFLKLVPSMFRSIHQGADRQRQVQLLVRATHDIGCSVIATGIDNEADFEICRELGCTLAQGNLFRRPQSVFALSHAPRAPACARKPAK